MSTARKVFGAPANWIEKLGRIGLIAKGLVYCITGILAFMAAFELGHATESDAGKKGVFKVIVNQPFGRIFLLIVAVGLVFFCIWRFTQAINDTEDKGTDARGLSKRAIYMFSGFSYSAMVVYAIKFLLVPQSNSSKKHNGFLQDLLNKSYGSWVICTFALLIVGVGIYQLYFALSGKYKKHVQKTNLQPKTKSLLLSTGMLGYVSRGIVWLIIGWLFIKAVLHHSANEAGGNDSAFQWLETSPFGSYLLAAMATGLICYGLFMFVRARYQPIGK